MAFAVFTDPPLSALGNYCGVVEMCLLDLFGRVGRGYTIKEEGREMLLNVDIAIYCFILCSCLLRLLLKSRVFERHHMQCYMARGVGNGQYIL